MESLTNQYNEKVLGNVDRFTSLLSTHTEKIKRGIINGILITLVLLVFGCLDFMTWTFDFTRIITLEYWTTIASKLTAAICSFNIGININWDYAIEKAIELKEAIKLYETLIKQKDSGNWDYYVNHIFNKHTKRRAYINYINQKIYRLNKFTRDKDKVLYSSVIPLKKREKETDEEWEEYLKTYDIECKELREKKSHNKYCIRRRELEYLKSEEYINANLDSVSVSYSRVDPSVFDLEIDAKAKKDIIKVKGNVGAGRARASSSIALSMVVISMFTTALVLSINQQQFVDQMQAFWYYLLTCIVDAGLVAWNVFRGTRSASAIISEELTTPYVYRNRVLTGYIGWKKENNIQPTKAYEEINRLVNEENNVIEMTQEEYEKKYLAS